MAFCSECGKELTDGAKFCANCGAAVGASETETKRKEMYDGQIHKCVYCGAELPSFATECPICGKELRGLQTDNSVKELAKKLEELENKRTETTGWASFIQKHIDKEGLDNIDKQKMDLIKNFPIPNTKEAIQEFLILASSNMKVELVGSKSEQAAQQALAVAWRAKYEQAYKKAQILSGFYFEKEITAEPVKEKDEKNAKGSGKGKKFLTMLGASAVSLLTLRNIFKK